MDQLDEVWDLLVKNDLQNTPVGAVVMVGRTEAAIRERDETKTKERLRASIELLNRLGNRSFIARDVLTNYVCDTAPYTPTKTFHLTKTDVARFIGENLDVDIELDWRFLLSLATMELNDDNGDWEKARGILDSIKKTVDNAHDRNQTTCWLWTSARLDTRLGRLEAARQTLDELEEHCRCATDPVCKLVNQDMNWMRDEIRRASLKQFDLDPDRIDANAPVGETAHPAQSVLENSTNESGGCDKQDTGPQAVFSSPDGTDRKNAETARHAQSADARGEQHASVVGWRDSSWYMLIAAMIAGSLLLAAMVTGHPRALWARLTRHGNQ